MKVAEETLIRVKAESDTETAALKSKLSDCELKIRKLESAGTEQEDELAKAKSRYSTTLKKLNHCTLTFFNLFFPSIPF